MNLIQAEKDDWHPAVLGYGFQRAGLQKTL
jgi:hypothetical protein